MNTMGISNEVLTP